MTKETISSNTSSISNTSSQSNSDAENSRNIAKSSSDIKIQGSDLKNNISKNDELESNASEAPKKLDPTHFGDWQINCKTIDF